MSEEHSTTPNKRSSNQALPTSAKRPKQGPSVAAGGASGLSTTPSRESRVSRSLTASNTSPEGKRQFEYLCPHENRLLYETPGELLASVLPGFVFQRTTFHAPDPSKRATWSKTCSKAARAMSAADQTQMSWIREVAECSVPAPCSPGAPPQVTPLRLAGHPYQMPLSPLVRSTQSRATSSSSGSTAPSTQRASTAAGSARTAISSEAHYLIIQSAVVKLDKKPDIVVAADPTGKKLSWSEVDSLGELTLAAVPLPTKEQVNEKVVQFGLELLLALLSQPTRIFTLGFLISRADNAGRAKAGKKKNGKAGNSRGNKKGDDWVKDDVKQKEEDAIAVETGGALARREDDLAEDFCFDLYVLTSAHLHYTRVEDCWGRGLAKMSQVFKLLLDAPLDRLGFLADLHGDSTQPTLLKLSKALFSIERPTTGKVAPSTDSTMDSGFRGADVQQLKCANEQLVTFGSVNNFPHVPGHLLKISWLPSAFSVPLKGRVITPGAVAEPRRAGEGKDEDEREHEEEIRVPAESLVLAYLNTVDELEGSIPKLVAAATLGPLLDNQRTCNVTLMSGKGTLLEDVKFESEEQCWSFVASVFKVFGILHKYHVGHKDPSSSNILFLHGRCMLIDFEASVLHPSLCDDASTAEVPALLQLMGTTRSDAFSGTPQFMALEAIACGNSSDYAWSPSQEVESVTFYALHTMSHFLAATLPSDEHVFLPSLPPMPYTLSKGQYDDTAFQTFNRAARFLRYSKSKAGKRAGGLIEEILAVQDLVRPASELDYWAARAAAPAGWATQIIDDLEEEQRKREARRHSTVRQRLQKLEDTFTKYAAMAAEDP